MRRGVAVTVGLAVAPLVAALILAAYTALAERSELSGAALILPVYYFPAACAELLIGLPIFLVLSRFRLVQWWSALLAGTSVAVLAAVTIGTSFVGLQGFLVMTSAGAASGLTFWMIWKLGKDAKRSVSH